MRIPQSWIRYQTSTSVHQQETTMSPAKQTMATLPCCPDMAPDDVCDVLDFYYRLSYPVALREANDLRIPVEVKLHFRLSRCPGPFALGNLVYTTTLLPGEKVKLFT